jgi:hypothetical protein
VVAFITALTIGLLGCLAVVLYGRRRKAGSPLSWGQAMAAATYAFFMFFWWYGVIPNTWILYASNELGWRKDKFLAHSGQALFGQSWLNWWPLDIPYQAVQDVIVALIYGLGIGIHLFMWAYWNDRVKERPAVVPASRYGRPLVRKG